MHAGLIRLMKGRRGDADSVHVAQRSLHTHAGAQLTVDGADVHVEVVALGNAIDEHDQIAPSAPSV